MKSFQVQNKEEENRALQQEMSDARRKHEVCSLSFFLLMNVATKRSLGSSPVLMQRISIEQPTIVLQHRQLILDFYFNEMLDEAKKEIRHCFVPPPLSLILLIHAHE